MQRDRWSSLPRLAFFQSRARIRWISGSALSNGLTGASAAAGPAARQEWTGLTTSIAMQMAMPDRRLTHLFGFSQVPLKLGHSLTGACAYPPFFSRARGRI